MDCENDDVSEVHWLRELFDEFDPSGRIVTLVVLYRYTGASGERKLLVNWDHDLATARWGAPYVARLTKFLRENYAEDVEILAPGEAGPDPMRVLAIIKTGEIVRDLNRIWPEMQEAESFYRGWLKRRGQSD